MERRSSQSIDDFGLSFADHGVGFPPAETLRSNEKVMFGKSANSLRIEFLTD